MNSNKLLIGVAPPRTNPLFRGFVEGTASLLDIFGTGAGRREPGTPENDAQALHGDVEQIAQDFYSVLASIAPTPEK